MSISALMRRTIKFLFDFDVTLTSWAFLRYAMQRRFSLDNKREIAR
jgi:hypothetical protein